jgi:hypothetical protein
MVGLLRGRIVGCGGVAYTGGMAFAFCDFKPSARRYKVTIVKAARAIIDKVLWANVDPDEPGAVRWVTTLGFKPTRIPQIFMWRLDK